MKTEMDLVKIIVSTRQVREVKKLWVNPSFGQVNVKLFRQVTIFGVIWLKDKSGSTFSEIVSVRPKAA